MSAIYQEVKAAQTRIEAKNKGLMDELNKAVAYIIFPSIGRAGLIVGGSYGHGIVFEHGKPVGEASTGQVTVGVQVGGQTFSMVVLFCTPEAYDRFRRGRIGFAANASADMAKAAASGIADYEKDVVARTYSQGGMLVEASIGVQSLTFKPKELLEEKEEKKAG